MKCENDLCLKKLVGKQRKYCSKKCWNIVNSMNELRTRSNTITGDTCRWCMDSKDGFCSEKHKGLYNNFRKGLDSELAIRKPKPTKKELKGYRKIEYALINVKK